MKKNTTIKAYIVGRVKLGDSLKNNSPEHVAKSLLKQFTAIRHIEIITGEWDLMIKVEIPTMEEYYQVAWGIAKQIDRGWGTIVAKEIE